MSSVPEPSEYWDGAESWAEIMAQHPYTGEDAAASLAQFPPDVLEDLVRSIGPIDCGSSPPPPPNSGFLTDGWHVWMARMFTRSMMTVGRDAFSDLLAVLRPHRPPLGEETDTGAIVGIVAWWAKRWNLDDGNGMADLWPERWRYSHAAVNLALPFVYFEARYLLEREQRGDALTVGDETARRFAAWMEVGLIGPLARWWQERMDIYIDAQVPPPMYEAGLTRVLGKKYAAIAKRAAENRAHQILAAYEAIGQSAPKEIAPRQFDRYVRFQVLEQDFPDIAKSEGLKGHNGVAEGVNKVADLTGLPRREGSKGGRPRDD